MFVCTANSLNIPAPLLDRMEVIRLPGYTEDEKINIAQRYLLPKQMKQNGLKDDELKVSDDRAARHHPLLHARSRRAQPRARDRQDLPQGGQAAAAAKTETRSRSRSRRRNLDKYLGVRRFRYGSAEEQDASARSPASRGPKSAASC